MKLFTIFARRSSRSVRPAPRFRPALESLEARRVLSTIHADFNGDGFDDLAIGTPMATVDGQANAGQVNVLYGSANGLTTTGSQLWTQNSPGVADAAEGNDYFGSTLASGDFNNDGYSDLVIGVHMEDLLTPAGTQNNAGAVHVLYGSATGLRASTSQSLFLTQGANGLGDTAEAEDWFGWSLAAGDFNGDGRDDLAIGSPLETVGSVRLAGMTHIIYSASWGLNPVNSQTWTQNSPGILGGVEEADWFGWSLAAGDFNGDGRDDLAIGAFGEAIGTIAGAGAVNVIYGSSTGLSSSGNQMWSQDSSGIPGGCEEWDEFGYTVAAGDFNGDGRDDLAIGVALEDVNGTDAGAVNVIYGSSTGLNSTGSQMFYQQAGGLGRSDNNANDGFGVSLAVGDFNNDGRDDLAIGAASEDQLAHDDGRIETIGSAGAVYVLPGTSTGLSLSSATTWHQNTSRAGGLVEDAAEAGDRYGTALAVGDFNGDGRADLAVGVPGESVGEATSAGAVNVLFGTGGLNCLTAVGDQFLTEAMAGLAGALVQANKQFGGRM